MMERLTFLENGKHCYRDGDVTVSNSDVARKLAAYEVIGLAPERVAEIIDIARWIVRDSRPFEADKILIYAGSLREVLNRAEVESALAARKGGDKRE